MEEKEIKRFLDKSERIALKIKEEIYNHSTIKLFDYWCKIESNDYKRRWKKDLIYVFKGIIPQDYINEDRFTIGVLMHVNYNSIRLFIEREDSWSFVKKKRLLGYYSEFIDWLNEMSLGLFDGYKKKHLVSVRALSQALSFPEWRTFIERLYTINERDELIARALLQGQKRISEVIRLLIKCVNFEENTIRFESKTKIDIVRYEECFMKQLKEYVQSTEGYRRGSPYVFITRGGCRMTRTWLNFSFARANKLEPSITKKVTPDSLRATWKMLLENGCKEKDIMQRKWGVTPALGGST